MNVVLLPVLASFFAPAVTDGALCLEGPCLLGWAWSILALALASAWIVQCWSEGGDVASRFAPAATPARIAASPRAFGLVAPQTDLAIPVPRPADLAALGLALRAPPTTDMAAAPSLQNSCAPGRSFPPRRLTLRSTGTPGMTNFFDMISGRPSPA